MLHVGAHLHLDKCLPMLTLDVIISLHKSSKFLKVFHVTLKIRVIACTHTRTHTHAHAHTAAINDKHTAQMLATSSGAVRRSRQLWATNHQMILFYYNSVNIFPAGQLPNSAGLKTSKG